MKDGQVQTYNEIPNGTYLYESPISNPDSFDILEQLGTGVNLFSLPKPENGEYAFSVSSAIDTNYTINVSAFEEDGDSEVSKSENIISAGSEKSFSINYSQTQAPSIIKSVTFQSIIDDISELYNLTLITHKSVANNLIRNIEQAQKAQSDGNDTKVQQNIDQFIHILDREMGRRITERAYNILLEDATSLF